MLAAAREVGLEPDEVRDAIVQSSGRDRVEAQLSDRGLDTGNGERLLSDVIAGSADASRTLGELPLFIAAEVDDIVRSAFAYGFGRAMLALAIATAIAGSVAAIALARRAQPADSRRRDDAENDGAEGEDGDPR